MQPLVDVFPPNVVGAAPTVVGNIPYLEASTPPRHPVGWRRVALWASLVIAPAAVGVTVARLASRRSGMLAGGLTALAIGALRVELARWFTPEPAYRSEGALGALELRAYPARVEARAPVTDRGFEAALEHGYSRLACFLYGANTTGEILARTTPILTAMRDGQYHVAFVMPTDRSLASLPWPLHAGVELREVPAHRVAALPFRGRFTRDNVAAHERTLLAQLVDAGLSARGSVAFAAFDSPATLPALRRNELWIEIL